MIFSFGQFQLDTGTVELHGPDGVVPLEPKCFALLTTLIENRERAVSKDALFELVWPGVFVTDASLATAIKQLRAALRDDGATQRIIKTVRGIGFRFVADVTQTTAASSDAKKPAHIPDPPMDRRPTIAVRPFQLIGADPISQSVAEAVPSEIIASLSRLGWVNVIARGSSFRFGVDAQDDTNMASMLGATYLVSGAVEFMGKALALYVQVTDTRTHQVLWSDRRSGQFDDVYELRAAMTRDLSNALELGISDHEAAQLALVPTENLDAWGHYHLGIRHMYRYNAADNQIAAQHFQRAITIDPDFSRAHAGLSYTEFQNAFQYFGTDTQHHINMTQRHAEKAVSGGDADPFCNLIYARARWLADDAEGGLVWIDRALRLNPNYALGYYNYANLNTVLCNDAAAEEASRKALFLSPMDPQLQSMYGTRAFAALMAGDLDAARRYSDHALNAPRPHLYVYIIAALIFRQSGDMARAEQCIAKIHGRNARFGKAEFLTRFNLRDPGHHKAVFDALADLGI